MDSGKPLASSCAGERARRGVGVFEEGGDGVETEAGDAAVEPEAHGVEHGLFDGGIAPVEVGLLLVEEVVVELAAGGDPLPRGALKSETQLLGGTTQPCGPWWALGASGLVAGLPSFQMYQSAWGLVRELAESMNQGCLSEVWLSTMSRRMRMWRCLAAAMRRSKSARVPYCGSTAS